MRAAFKKFAARHKVPSKAWKQGGAGNHRNMSIPNYEPWEDTWPPAK